MVWTVLCTIYYVFAQRIFTHFVFVQYTKSPLYEKDLSLSLPLPSHTQTHALVVRCTDSL